MTKTELQVLEKLTSSERNELAKLERSIEKGREAVLEALIKIQEKRLYKETHFDFKSYLKERFEITSSRFYQLTRAKRFRDGLSTESVYNCTRCELNEGQIRELKRFPTEEHERILEEARTNAPKGRLTAAIIKATGNKLLKPPVEVVSLCTLTPEPPQPVATEQTASHPKPSQEPKKIQSEFDWEADPRAGAEPEPAKEPTDPLIAIVEQIDESGIIKLLGKLSDDKLSLIKEVAAKVAEERHRNKLEGRSR